MIFRRYYTLQSKKNAEDLRQLLLGQHLKVHVLDFEVMDRDGDLKIIPHAEDEDHIYTLPITRLRMVNDANGGCTIKMMSKPRRIDIGGPYLVMIFVVFALLAALLVYFFGQGKYNNTAYILSGISLLVFLLLWFRLEKGYFDYIRKVKDWVKSKA
jgi:hypothetical protein